MHPRMFSCGFECLTPTDPPAAPHGEQKAFTPAGGGGTKPCLYSDLRVTSQSMNKPLHSPERSRYEQNSFCLCRQTHWHDGMEGRNPTLQKSCEMLEAEKGPGLCRCHPGPGESHHPLLVQVMSCTLWRPASKKQAPDVQKDDCWKRQVQRSVSARRLLSYENILAQICAFTGRETSEIQIGWNGHRCVTCRAVHVPKCLQLSSSKSIAVNHRRNKYLNTDKLSCYSCLMLRWK